jgi:hypothetical protein
MTTERTTEEGPDTREPAGAAVPAAAPAETDVARPQRRGPLRRGMFAATIVVAAGAIPVLGYVGVHEVLNSTNGRVVDPVLDPDEEGYEAAVTPTPVSLLAHVDAEGRLDGVTILALSAGGSGGGGGVLFVPVDTLTTESTSALGFDRLRGAYETAGLELLRDQVSVLLGTSVTDAALVSPERWAELVAPVAPITLDNPDDVVASNGARFPAGPLELTAEQVPVYLSARNPGESELARLVRHQFFWEAWLAAVAAADEPAVVVPGEGTEGVARFVRGLAAGEVEFDTLPVEPAEAPQDGTSAFAPLPEEVAALVARLVPLPTAAAPGSRVRVRVLDGTGTDGAVAAAVERLVPAGAEIVIVGNADRFTYDTTELRYREATGEESARELQEALGTGAVESVSSPDEAFDVTVVVGGDFLDLVGLTTTTAGMETEGGTTG